VNLHNNIEITRLETLFGWAVPDVLGESSANETEISYPVQAHSLLDDYVADSFWARHRTAVISEFLSRSDPTVLWDVGAGVGMVGASLRSERLSVLAVEPMVRGARSCAAKGLPTFCGTLDQLSLPQGSIGAIGLFDVLEHLAEPQTLLRECVRVLARNGVVIATVPAHQFLWSQDDVASGHFRRYNIESIRDLFASSGLNVVAGSHFFSFLVIPGLIKRKLRRRGKLRTNEQLDREAIRSLQPPEMVERIFSIFAKLELRLIKKRRLRFGTSIVVVASPM
jgi:2-polyprenyl-3-methyl-5-hydroxy-6-metoxy-1,4-benzoquinol methylase